MNVVESCNNALPIKNLYTKKIINKVKLAEIAENSYETDQYLEGKLLYDSLIALDSPKSGYYFKRAYCESNISSISQDAINDYLTSIKMNYSRKDLAYVSIGMIYCFQTKYDSAVYCFNECLKIDPLNEYAIKGKQAAINILNDAK